VVLPAFACESVAATAPIRRNWASCDNNPVAVTAEQQVPKKARRDNSGGGWIGFTVG